MEEVCFIYIRITSGDQALVVQIFSRGITRTRFIFLVVWKNAQTPYSAEKDFYSEEKEYVHSVLSCHPYSSDCCVD